MDHIKIICPLESAYSAIRTIASLDQVQLDDSNTGTKVSNKRYTETYLKCEEADNSLKFIENYLTKTELLPPAHTIDNAIAYRSQASFIDVMAQIHDADTQLREKISIFTELSKQSTDRKLKLNAIRFYRPLIDQDNNPANRHGSDAGLIELDAIQEQGAIVKSIVTFIQNDMVHKFLNTVLRLSRRNIIYHIGEAVEDQTPIAIFASSETVLKQTFKICESYSSSVYEFPGDTESLKTLEAQLVTEIEQISSVDTHTLDANLAFLRELASSYWDWESYVAREKQIWSTMDFGDFEAMEGSVIFKGWCPLTLSPTLESTLRSAQVESGIPIDIHVEFTHAADLPKSANLIPPTFIPTSDFSSSFQMLNDAYGVPEYDELNGGAFYGMYPFLFGIMFGDIGHAFFYCLITLAMFLIGPITRKMGKPIKSQESIDSLKWLLLFASFFSLYCGFIYNECFGIPINIFGTHWTLDSNASAATMEVYKAADSKVYPFGIDPEWFFKDNELIFMNSYKMKLSIVMGMIQMFFGLFLQLINHVHRRDWVELFLSYIPQVMYMVPFFGYLVSIIILKWTIVFKGNSFYPSEQQSNGVDLIQIMIGMIMEFGTEDSSLHLYNGQWNIQKPITVIFFISIPLFLLAKPTYEIIKQKMNQKKGVTEKDLMSGDQAKTGEATNAAEPQLTVLEIFVMNLIHVIEFCLSALSHTASYLRLWALSLAHSQLSKVLYDELIVLTINGANCFEVFIGFAGFAVMTVAILLGMEAFSALLHAIRLMWVEFCSKFYSGMGYAFHPLSLKDQLKSAGFL